MSKKVLPYHTGGDNCASDNRYIELKLQANFPSYSTTVTLYLETGMAIFNEHGAYVGLW